MTTLHLIALALVAAVWCAAWLRVVIVAYWSLGRTGDPLPHLDVRREWKPGRGQW